MPLERGDIPGRSGNVSDDDYGSSGWKYLDKGFITDNEGTLSNNMSSAALFVAVIYVKNGIKYNSQGFPLNFLKFFLDIDR